MNSDISKLLLAAALCATFPAPEAAAIDAAYVHILKNSTSDTRFHLAEVEAFADSASPNNSGGATFGGMSTSTNDIGDTAGPGSTRATYGDGNTHPTIGTTTSLEHGGANKNPNNVLENGAAVWSTATGLGTPSQYTLDLGGTHDVTTVRMWPRADTCCVTRWQNLEIQLLDAARNPVSGTLKLATAPGGNVPLEFTFPEDGSIDSFTVSPETIPPNAPVTLSWQIDTGATAASISPISGDLGSTVGNVLPPPTTVDGVGSKLIDPGPSVTTIYRLSVTAGGEVSTEDVTVTVDNKPIINSFTSNHSSVAPGIGVTLSWDVANFDEIYINGVLFEGGGTSLIVAPLVSTVYTLQATNASGSTNANLSITVVDVPDLLPANGRFVEVVKNDTANTMLHISEIEAFEFGVNPNDADADGTSTNGLVQNGSPSVEAPPTTTSLAQGSEGSVYDGDIESGTDVWTTANGLGVEPRYMLDLGETAAIDKVRVFGRGDTSFPERLQNFTVNVYADNGSGAPGALVSSESFVGTAPAGNVDSVELSLGIPDPGISSFTVDKSLIPQADPIVLSWQVSVFSTSVTIDDGSGPVDVTAMTDASGAGSLPVAPGPTSNTIYQLTAVRPNGTSVAEVAVDVTNQPLIYSFTGAAGIVAPGTPVALSWDVANAGSLLLNGAPVTGTGTTVMPVVTTTYTLTAINTNGTTDEDVRIRVVIPGEPIISEFMASNDSGELDEDGEPSDWIEICNPSGTPVLLDGYYLTDDAGDLTKWRIPDVTLPANGYLLVFASGNDRANPVSELHTNFSLDVGGEYLALVKPDGTTVVTEFSPSFPSQRTDVSYGFDPVALQEGFFLAPTPGLANTGGFSDFVGDTAFSLDRGFYTTPIAVAITTPTPGAEIRYTVDGTKPTATLGLVYAGPIGISQTTVLRAAAFKPGYVPTNVDTHTYIFTTDVIAHSNMDTGITQDATYGPQMDASLKAVPTVSLVFQGDIDRIEKEASVELINFEAGDTQLDAGMERFGNYVTNFAKRGMRLNFRKQYGPGKLKFPVFDGYDYPILPAAPFDSIDLRSGNHDMVSRGAYMSNRFTDDTMLDMGQIAPHGRFVHVYLNGLYWGQYHMRERWNAAMLSEYYGGVKDDYEAINANNTGSNFLPGTVYDGTGQYWSETQSLVDGANPYSSSRGHLDVANMLNFMMLWVSGNSESEFRAAGSVPLGVPFKFFMKDADGFLRASSRTLNHQGPINSLSRFNAEGDPDFKILMADEIHRHYFNGGAFTPARNIARLQARVDEIQTSFISEAARWGYRSPSSWQSYQDNLLNNYLPGLTATMLGRFQTGGYYPSTVAPSFSQHGGVVPPGFQLAITAPAATIYYTLDGSDPREPADPVVVDPPEILVTESAAKKVYVPTTATDGFSDGVNSWNEAGYDDSAWTAGTGGVGYETGNGYQSYFDIDVEATMHDKETSCLIRIPFSIAAGALDGKSGAQLRVRYDDGYVAYLNGTQVAFKNYTGTFPPDGNASGINHTDGAAIVLEAVDISAHFGLLNEGGANVLAIHGLNTSTGSSDFLMSADLRVSSEPVGGTGGGAISDTAIEYTGAVPISATTEVKARVLDTGGNWSALNASTFVQDFSVLVVSEFMYDPPSPTPAEVAAGFNDSDDFEYLELLNTGAGVLDLTGVQFVDGIGFDFTGSTVTSLPPGGRVLIVEDAAAFAFRYGAAHPVAGQYTGKLKNGGETLELVDALGGGIQMFTYDNNAPWPSAAAGLGASLVLLNPSTLPDHNLAASWVAGTTQGGTPGGDQVPSQSYADFASSYGVGAEGEDPELDDLDNFTEFMLLGNPLQPSEEVLPALGVTTLPYGQGTADFLTVTFTHNLAAAGATISAQVSPDLTTWNGGFGYTVLFGRTYHGDGSATSVYRSEAPIVGGVRQFIRAHFETPGP